jgi:chemotaxis protein CheC
VKSALGEEKADALQELVNMGMGSAGEALASALDAFVELRVPRIELVAPSRLAELLLSGPWAEREFACVRQTFFGGLMGESLMLLHGVDHARLPGLLGPAADDGAEIDDEMLLDIANAAMGACVNGITQALEESVSFSPPCLLGSRAETQEIVNRQISEWSQIMFIDVDFRLEDRRFESRVLVFLSESSLARIDGALTRLLEGLDAS